MQPASIYWLPIVLGCVWLSLAGLGLARLRWLWRAQQTNATAMLLQVVLPLVCLLAGAEWLWRQMAPKPYRVGQPGEFVLVVVGGSTAEGRPRCASFGPSIARALGGEIDGQRIIPHVLAQGGHSVFPQAVALERTLADWPQGVPGAVLIYAGHNDRIHPDDGTPWYWPVEHALARSLWLVRDGLWMLRQGRWTERTASLTAYHDLLEQMVVQTRQTGLIPIVSTVASNLIDLEPGIEVGAEELASGATDARGAEAWWLFQRARKAYEAGDYQTAQTLAWQAVDRDQRVMFGRATTRQNQVVREVALRHGAVFVDGVAAVAAGAPHGIPGSESFIDGHHPSTAAYARLSAAMAAGLAKRVGAAVVAPPDPNAAVPDGCDPNEVARALVGGASWLLATSTGSVPMPHRLALAEADLWRSLALAPSWSAWAGLALVHAARRADQTHSDAAEAPPLTTWIERMHASHREEFCLSAQDAAAVPGWLQTTGVPGLVAFGLTVQSMWDQGLCGASQQHGGY